MIVISLSFEFSGNEINAQGLFLEELHKKTRLTPHLDDYQIRMVVDSKSAIKQTSFHSKSTTLRRAVLKHSNAYRLKPLDG